MDKVSSTHGLSLRHEIDRRTNDGRRGPIVDTEWFPWVLTAAFAVGAAFVILLVRVL